MLSLIHHRSVRSFTAAVLIACVFSLSVPSAAAEGSDSDKSTVRESSANVPAATSGADATAGAKTPAVLYVAFGVGAPPVEPAPEPASRPRRVTEINTPVTTVNRPLPPQNSQANGVISTAPMTVGEKFGAWFKSRFLSPGAYGSAIFNGLYKEALDNDDFKKDTVQNYFADSMTRAARSYAFGTTAGFFEKAVFASLFRQDPRYHRSGKTGAGAKLGYAVTRVFITQGDRCGCHQVNASFLLGAAAATGAATLWERRERTGEMHTISRFYNHIALTALFNVVKEFVGGQ